MKIVNYILITVVSIALIVGCTKSDVISHGGGENGGASGKSGSMAKFSIKDDHLFLINDSSLLVFDIANESNPVKINSIQVDFGIETVFTLKDKLFIGSINGVYIYDIGDPSNILYLSYYEHITSCDPVVANDTLAFATLNSASECRWQNGNNQLDIIDIRNIVFPQNISSIQMRDPKGLAVDSNFVFVCNGTYGVDIYDFSNPNNLKLESGISGIDAYDIILDQKILYLVGKKGLFQYDYSDIYRLELISNILF